MGGWILTRAHSICSIFSGRNEVVAKVMFLQVSVILSTGGSAPGGVPGPGGGLVPGSGGVCSWGVPGGDPPGTVTAAGGTHPTGMHSCFANFRFTSVIVISLFTEPSSVADEPL